MTTTYPTTPDLIYDLSLASQEVEARCRRLSPDDVTDDIAAAIDAFCEIPSWMMHLRIGIPGGGVVSAGSALFAVLYRASEVVEDSFIEGLRAKLESSDHREPATMRRPEPDTSPLDSANAPDAIKLSDLHAGDWVSFVVGGNTIMGEVKYFGCNDVDIMTYADDNQPEDLLYKHVPLENIISVFHPE